MANNVGPVASILSVQRFGVTCLFTGQYDTGEYDTIAGVILNLLLTF